MGSDSGSFALEVSFSLQRREKESLARSLVSQVSVPTAGVRREEVSFAFPHQGALGIAQEGKLLGLELSLLSRPGVELPGSDAAAASSVVS